MQTIEDLKNRIESTEALQSVVKTMKAMAAVKIRQYERAVEALKDYTTTVESGLQILFRNRGRMITKTSDERRAPPGIIIFGSDQGMCGQLNDQIVSFALDQMGDFSDIDGKAPVIAAVGARVKARIEDAGRSVRTDFSLPDSTFNIVSKVQDILALIEDWTTKKRMNLIFLYHSKQVSGARYEQHSVRLLPVDQEWLGNMQKRPWPNHCIPLFTMDWNVLFSALIRQYLFISVFRAFAESMASENASRLAAMQGAEKNIQDRLEELRQEYHQKRQMGITEELLDIVSGFEVLRGER